MAKRSPIDPFNTQTGLFIDENGNVYLQNAGTDSFSVDSSGTVQNLSVGSFAGLTLTDDLTITNADAVQTAAEGAEIQWEMGATGSFSDIDGVADAATNPRFRLGRIVDGPVGAKYRILYQDDEVSPSEYTVMEFEGSGTVSSVRRVGKEGSHFEGFLEGESKPLFRLNSFGGMTLELGTGGSNETDVSLRRTAAGVLRLYNKETDTNGQIDLGIISNGQGVVRFYNQSARTYPAALTPSGDTETVNWNNSNIQFLNLGSASGDVTLTLSNPAEGADYEILIEQGASARNVVWPAAVRWPGGSAPTISTGNGETDVITLRYRSGVYYAYRDAAAVS